MLKLPCFTGFPDYELKPGGTDIAVDAANVEEYVDAVVQAMLHGGIQHQMAAFRWAVVAVKHHRGHRVLLKSTLALL